MLMSVKHEIAITCEFCCDLHLTLRVFWSKQKIPLKESEVRQKVISHKIMVMPMHTRFIVFVPLPFGCISSLIKTDHSFVHLTFLKFV